VRVDRFVEAMEDALREKPFQTQIGLHGLFVGFPDLRVGMFSADAEVPACACVPPELEGVRIVFAQVDVEVIGML